MKFIYSDGGRSKYFKADNVGDCVTRAICNATGLDYKYVYDRLNEMAKKESVKRHRRHQRSQSRNGVFKETWKRFLKEIGWVHHSTCEIGSSKEKVKFVEGALPNGVLIVQLSRHLTCLKDQVIYDTYDCSKKDYYDWQTGDLVTNEERCVYGYWTAPKEEETADQEHVNSIIKEQKESLKETKIKIFNIKKEFNKEIQKLKYQILLLEGKRDRAIAKVKKEDAEAFMEKWMKKADEETEK